MRLAPGIGAFAITFALGVAGLFATGIAGGVSGFVWLGVFPGMALARLLLPGAPAITRWTLGVTLSPLAASVAGAALVQSGLSLADAARLVGVGSWLLFAGGEARALTTLGHSDADAPADRGAAVWIAAAALLAAIPLCFSPQLLVRGDSWVHATAVREIFERAVPALDPRFAGLPTDHVWFHTLFIALASSIRSEPQPFLTLAVAQVTWMAAQAALAWQLAWTVWRDRASACAALPMFLAWLYAGASALMPLWLAGARTGEQAAPIAGTAWNRSVAMHDLAAPLIRPRNSWDGYTLGTPLDVAWLMLLLWWWAGARWLEESHEARADGAPPAWRWLAVAAAASAGMMLFNRDVAYLALPVGIGGALVLAGLARTRWRVLAARRALALACASAAGLAAALPYSLGLLRDGSSESSSLWSEHPQVDGPLPWTLFAACAVTLLLAHPSLRRVFSERRGAGVWLALWAAGMALFVLVTRMQDGSVSRFLWPLFAPLAILGGASLPGAWTPWRARPLAQRGQS